MARRRPPLRTRLLTVPTLVVGLLACAAPHANAAPTTDPVVTALRTARMQRVITAAELADLTAVWARSARAERTVRSSARRRVVADSRANLRSLAARRLLTPVRVKPAMLGVEASTWLATSTTPLPSHEQEVTMPGEVVVFTYYSGNGLQFQPFETLKQGMRELNQKVPDIEAARAIADRLLELRVDSGTSTSWEYFFPWGGPARPWTSAISQSLATEFFWRVGQGVDPAERAPYDEVAERVARSFLRAPSVGGVGVPTGGGRYYLMYTFLPTQRILNGHLQVLINLNRYAAGSGSPVAKRVFDQGVAAIVPMLPQFDTGAWSNYQLGQEADLNYATFQAEQLVTLGEETGNEAFVDYGQRFTGYLTTPPTVTFPTSAFQAIFPAGDGYRDAVTAPIGLDKRAKVTLVVRDASGVEVARTSTSSGRGATSITWDGRTATGTRAVPGDYVGTLTATDIAGNRATFDLPAPLRVVADTAAPVLRLLTTRQRGKQSIVTVDAYDVGSAWITATITVRGRVVATARGPRSGQVELRATMPVARLRTGVLQLTDTSGNTLTYPLAG